MKEGSQRQIDQQYTTLKSKVEDEIRLLEEKLSKNTEIHYHKAVNSSSKTVQVPSKLEYNIKMHQGSGHTHNNCIHNSGYHCGCKTNNLIHNYSHCYNNSNPNHCSHSNSQIRQQSCSNSRHHQLTQNGDKSQTNYYKIIETSTQNNAILEEALIKSLENQKQLAYNLKLLNQKIQKLSQSRTKSIRNQQIFSDDNLQNRNSGNSFHDQYSSHTHSYRPKSLLQNKQKFNVLREYISRKNLPSSQRSNNSKSKSKSKTKLLNRSQKKDNSGSKSEYLFHVRSDPRIKGPSFNSMNPQKVVIVNHTNKLNENWKQDYFGGDHVCPVHTKPTLKKFKSKDKQVYQDTYHRNRKHQRDHLVESYKQQEIARKKLMAKIVQYDSNHHMKIK